MCEILLFLATYCRFLFAPGRFRIIDSRSDEGFGNAMVVLESAKVRLRIARDRGQLLLVFQPIAGKQREWFSLGLLRGVLLGHRGGSEVLDASWASFLASSIDELETRLADPERASELMRDLHNQEQLRAKELFG